MENGKRVEMENGKWKMSELVFTFSIFHFPLNKFSIFLKPSFKKSVLTLHL